MNVIGNGQLGRSFKERICGGAFSNTTILASGVSDSTCTDLKEFQREEVLIRKSIENNLGHKVVYFSSSALSADFDYCNSEYYKHKLRMEKIINEYDVECYIFRIPQIFGNFFSHKTIINFFFDCIVNGVKFKVYSDAERYLVHVDDVSKFVLEYIKTSNPGVIDFANPYRYKVLDLVTTIESILDVKGNYDIVNVTDKYSVDFSLMEDFIKNNSLDFGFGPNYFFEKASCYYEGLPSDC